MGTKTISIRDDAYGLLVAVKAPDESSSDEIRRLLKPRGSIMDFAGAWKDLSEEDINKMKARICKRRKDHFEKYPA